MRQRQVIVRRAAGEPCAGAAARRGACAAGGARPARSCRAAQRSGRSGRPADGRGRREGASRVEALSATDLRHIVDPDDVAATHALAARLARVMRARLVRREQIAPPRAAARSAPHHPSQRRAWRHADRSRLAATQDKAAAAGRAARCVRLDEPLHRVLRPLPARRRRQLPRGGSVRLPHPARPCVAVAARPRRDPRGGEARADGAGHRRRHRASAKASPPSIAGTRGASSIRAPR